MLVTISIYLVYTLGIWEIREMKVVAEKKRKQTETLLFRFVFFFLVYFLEMEKCDENCYIYSLFGSPSFIFFIFLFVEHKTFFLEALSWFMVHIKFIFD